MDDARTLTMSVKELNRLELLGWRGIQPSGATDILS